MTADLETRLETYAKEFNPRAADFADALVEIRTLRKKVEALERDDRERQRYAKRLRMDNDRLRARMAQIIERRDELSIENEKLKRSASDGSAGGSI